jgi:thioredoxin-dependent peroxiredoxin
LPTPTTPSPRRTKSRYGRTYMGIVRSTFVIGPDGSVLKAMRNVQPATHADDVLAVLSQKATQNG